MMNRIKRNILLDTIIIVLVFIILNLLLNQFYIRFRQWVYYFILLLTIVGTFIGMIQIFKRGSKISKVVIVFIGIVVALFAIIYWQIILLCFAFSYKPEHVITRDGKKYVAEVSSFLDVNVSYYDYINVFVVGTKEKISEYYGNGGYNPFDEEHRDSKPLRTYYYDYDDDGNIIESNSEYYNKETSNDLKNEDENKNEILQNNMPEEIVSEYKEILYEKKIDDNIIIRVVNKGYVLAQRSLIGIEKTTDGGNTWEEQIEAADGWIQIHNGSKFVFINEKVGFINDPGLAGTAGENRSLLVTTDGGKKFSDAKLISSKENLYIEDVPYVEDNILKLKAYTIENSEKIYYEFYSEDNGKTWKK